jgi:hypothetical protein
MFINNEISMFYESSILDDTVINIKGETFFRRNIAYCIASARLVWILNR